MEAPSRHHMCQVCGYQEDIDFLSPVQDSWFVHRIQMKTGYIVILTCCECNQLSHDMIFEYYKLRIRAGEIPGFH